MLLKTTVLFCMCASLSYGIRYSVYTAEPLTEEQIQEFEANNLIENCTVDIQPCDPNERKRVDGSCNNLKYPGRGVYTGPQARLLNASFYNGTHQRKAKSGKDLPLARQVRTSLLKVGKSSNQKLNHNVGAFLIFMFLDNGSPHDIVNFITGDTFCCEKRYQNDDRCTPTIVPEDDPVHRFSGIRCLNSTRPLSHQTRKCTSDPVPSPIQLATSASDLSQIYNSAGKGDSVIRSFKNGELSVETENGQDFPPNGPSGFCPNNVGNETRCFENFLNGLLPVNMFTVWFVTHHNWIARQLALVNPCWDDETLFQVSRDINIAYAYQIYLYEVFVALQGKDYLIEAGVIVEDGECREVYDDNKYPMMYIEYNLALRWFHLLQETTAKLLDDKFNLIEKVPLFELIFRPGYLAKDNNMEYLTRSTFMPCRAADWSIDFDTAERGLPYVQKVTDILAGDLNKNRHYGLAPYIDYVYLFYGRNITCFEDLAFLIDPERIILMKEIYEDVSDLDYLVGSWLENNMKGGEMPLTQAHIMNTQALWTITSDRHWYERCDRPYAFTKAQLKEIRKGNLALMLCNVGKNINEVPKNAFLNISPENPLVDCSEIPKMDFSAWADEKCNKM